MRKTKAKKPSSYPIIGGGGLGLGQSKPKKPLHYLMFLFFFKYLAVLGLSCGTQL